MSAVADPGQTANPDAKGTGYATDLRILVADGCADSANTLACLLNCLGADAKACYSGPEAIEAALADPPDAILSELSLPLMDGGELVRRLREREELQKTRLIAVTAWADEQSRRMAQKAGFQFFYVKPLGDEEIEDILRQARRSKGG
jgi:CheY-like chemotaxis protein